MNRPYLRKSLNELVEVFKNSNDDLQSMRVLLAELDERNTAAATSLQVFVSKRIVKLMESSRSGVSPIQENENVGDRSEVPDRTAQIVMRQTSEQDLEAPDTDDASPGTGASGDLADTLDEIRQRLLDLTRRNALLNYRHPRGRSIRVIDEMPDQLFDRILGGDRFVFEPLPRVPLPHEEIPEEIREFLEAQKSWQRPSRIEWAQMHDINPGFELPAVGSEEQRHTDLAIQTLLFPDELETRLRTIGANARTAIEESGANILYLAFGFLEWTESEHSDQKSLAPLLLLPVTLKKSKKLDSQTRREKYGLEYSGEDLQSNLSLQEKLIRDFSLKLPVLDDEDTPEKYFSRCDSLLTDNPTWSVHRFVTLGFFQFGKLLMYLDLDPERWPADAKIENHALVEKLLTGASDDAGTPSIPIDVDSIPLDAPEALIIESADSSQHQAIVDASQGRSMVIEGPPGTGKSQTITNIIGVSLAQGKSVLFVSEKLAALEVVKSRLENAGLGQFCLELHSRKTQKRKFLDDLEKRVEMRRPASQNRDPAVQRSNYESKREQISKYLRAISVQVPDYEMSRHDLFCGAAELGSRLPAEVFDSISISSLEEAPDSVKRQHAIGLAKNADSIREAIEAATGDLSSHPLYGLMPVSADEAKAGGDSRLQQWWQSAIDLRRHAFSEERVATTAQLTTLGMLSKILSIYDMLDRSVCETYRIEELCSQPNPAIIFKRLLDKEQHLFDVTSRASEIWDFESSNPEVVHKDVSSAAALLCSESLRLTGKHANDISRIDKCLNGLSTQLNSVADGIRELQQILGTDFEQDKEGLKTAEQVITLSAQRPRQSLSTRQPILESLRNYDLLNVFAEEHRDLGKTKAKLSIQFDLPDAVDVDQIEAVVPILREASLLSRFRSDWRSANEIYQGLRHKRTWFKSSTAKAKDLVRVINYHTKKRRFERNTDYAAMLGPLFKGMDTAAEDIVDICSWFGQVRDSLSDQPDVKGTAAQRLMQLPDNDYARIDQIGTGAFISAAPFVKGALDDVEELDPDISAHLFAGGWQAVAQRNDVLKDRVKQASRLIFRHCKDKAIHIDRGLEILNAIVALHSDEARKRLHASLLLVPRPGTWVESDISILEKTLKLAIEIEKEDADSVFRKLAVLYASSTGDIREKTSEVSRLQQSFMANRERVAELFEIDDKKLFGGLQEDIHIDSVVDRLELVQASGDDVDSWCSLCSAAESLEAVIEGSGDLKIALFDKEISCGTYSTAVEYLTLAKVAEVENQKDPILNRFSSEAHAKTISDFRKLDDELRAIASYEVSSKLLDKHVPAGTTGRLVGDLSELALLRWEIGKQRRHIPIRKLVHRAGNALKALKPCFMMGPLSVAQYLSPGEVSFDIIIMDEASQMRPEDSLGAIARGAQLIVVGDPKQLPPTSFFDRLNDDSKEDEDEELTFGSQESILDIAAPILGSTRILSWHYRSRHQSLIAFSNYSFYDNKLLLFPTAHSADKHLGVVYNRVNGSYSTQTNEEEAQELIRAVVHEIKSGRRRSIGIVAVNVRQADVLRDTWDRYIREMPEIEELLAEDEDQDDLERLFIKNLENVQGDERDVIFISLTYGKDPNGNFFQRFGPINRDTGWRRLNVLFTRAREQMVVFSSMDSAMIVAGATAKRGVIVLKDFLSFCETGIVPESPRQTDRGPDSAFEIDVAEEVEKFGLRAEYQVGVAGFFVDIGVFDPREPGHYLMGIECDGATYHSSQSARDRDKIRQEILENLGWNIYRIWSTDWFRNSVQEREKLRSALRAVRLEADSRASMRESADVSVSVVREAESEYSAMELPLDEVADLEIEAPAVPDLESRLLDLRVRLDEDFPDVKPENALLRDELISAFLAHRPVTVEEFHQSIPLAMRQQIDLKQASAYLSTVLMMME